VAAGKGRLAERGGSSRCRWFRRTGTVTPAPHGKKPFKAIKIGTRVVMQIAGIRAKLPATGGAVPVQSRGPIGSTDGFQDARNSLSSCKKRSRNAL
jgi:hypothetical protein